MVGSPYFMSPEQVRGAREVDARSDLFSLGAVAYLCLTGRTPFTGAMPAVFLAILEGRPPSVTSLRPELPATLDAFFARALATEPRDRFATAIELASALRGALDAAPRATAAVSEVRSVRTGGRPRVVVLDSEPPPRPSAFPTAISAIPAEILRSEGAPTVMPPRSPSPPDAAIAATPPHPPRGGTDDPDLPPVLASPPARGASPPQVAPSPVSSRAPVPSPSSVSSSSPVSSPAVATPRFLVPTAAPPAPAPAQTIILDEVALVAPPAAHGPGGAGVESGVGPGFSIAMRSYQPSVWAAPPRPRPARRERLRAAVPLVLASMAGFVLAVAVLVIVWAAFG
jgi:serine/threonine-protein kinase